MKFVCSTFGSAGDVFPLLGLALELRNRGHEIFFATSAYFEDIIRSHDLPFESLGTKEQFIDSTRNPDLWRPTRAFQHIFRSLQPVLKRQYEIHAEQSAHGNTIGITNCLGFGALLAQDKLGIPVITIHLQPAVIWSDILPPTLPGMFGPNWLRSIQFRIAEKLIVDATVGRFLNPWRKELGLSPVRKTMRWWNSAAGVLCLFPKWFAEPQSDWPGNLMQSDFPLWNDGSQSGLPAEVTSFLEKGEAPVVFTPGSANQHGKKFFEAAVEACRSLNRRAIFLTGFPEQIPASLPDSIAHFHYVPLDLILPRASAFVHHGGVGSMSQALAAGIPQIIMPLAHDQFDNATRIEKLGVGNWIPVNQFTGPRLATNLLMMTASQTVVSTCKSTSTRLARRDGLSQSADLIETRGSQLQY